MKKNNADLILLAVISTVLIVVGCAFATLYIFIPDENVDPTLKKVALYGGMGLFAFGCIFLAVAVTKISERRREKIASRETFRKLQNELMQEKQEKQRVIPEGEAFKTVVVGTKQPVEEKFAEIAKMDKSQFVFYAARLFALKGYGIKFTPVVDNFGVDLLIERGETSLAVGCFLTNSVISEKELSALAQGISHYRVSGAVAVTNRFFDRSALELGRKTKISLVDKNILAEEYMK